MGPRRLARNPECNKTTTLLPPSLPSLDGRPRGWLLRGAMCAGELTGWQPAAGARNPKSRLHTRAARAGNMKLRKTGL